MISTTSEYALRALVALASEENAAALQARELARLTEISPSYLYKILAALRRSGILAGSRGSRGGYRLARNPEQMRLIDVVALFETVRPQGACLLSDSRECDENHPCGAHQHWKRVQENYREFLETRTIADLVIKDGA